jgi:hypothetical protein
VSGVGPGLARTLAGSGYNSKTGNFFPLNNTRILSRSIIENCTCWTVILNTGIWQKILIFIFSYTVAILPQSPVVDGPDGVQREPAVQEDGACHRLENVAQSFRNLQGSIQGPILRSKNLIFSLHPCKNDTYEYMFPPVDIFSLGTPFPLPGSYFLSFIYLSPFNIKFYFDSFSLFRIITNFPTFISPSFRSTPPHISADSDIF